MNNVIDHFREIVCGQQNANTQILIDSYFYKQPIRIFGLFRIPIGNTSRLLSLLPSFTVILVVLGTFIGLTESIFSMQHALLNMGRSGTQVTADTILSTIASPFKGISLAFITSIAGIGASLILNLIQGGFLSKGKSLTYIIERFLTEFEAFLDHTVQMEMKQEKPSDPFEKILNRYPLELQRASRRH